MIDQRDSRRVLCGSNFAFALGLVMLGECTDPATLFLAWLVLGVAMAAGLYEPAFAALTRLYGHDSRGAITGITLIGGAPAVTLFAVIHGDGNGLLTIVRDTLPSALFGPAGYGARIGRISAPARVGQALAPFAIGISIDKIGATTLAISTGLSLAAFISLLPLSQPRPRADGEIT